jgi:hypothetical protein
VEELEQANEQLTLRVQRLMAERAVGWSLAWPPPPPLSTLPRPCRRSHIMPPSAPITPPFVARTPHALPLLFFCDVYAMEAGPWVLDQHQRWHAGWRWGHGGWQPARGLPTSPCPGTLPTPVRRSRGPGWVGHHVPIPCRCPGGGWQATVWVHHRQVPAKVPVEAWQHTHIHPGHAQPGAAAACK